MRPIAPGLRAAIVQDLHRGHRQAQIARRHGVSAISVKRIRICEGLQPRPTDAVRIAAARMRDVRLLHVRWRRARMVVDLLQDAEQLRERLFAPYTVTAFGGSTYHYVEAELEEPDPEGKLAIMISVAIAIDKSLMLDRRGEQVDAAARAAIFNLPKPPHKGAKTRVQEA